MTAKELFEKLMKDGDLPLRLDEKYPDYIESGIIVNDDDDFIVDNGQCYPPHYNKKQIMEFLEEECENITKVIERYEKAFE